jgi:hypothetical protein
MDAVPDELLLLVFAAARDSIVAIRRVCRRWHAVADDTVLGRCLALRVRGDVVPVVSPGLASLMYVDDCSLATVAAAFRRYRRLETIVLNRTHGVPAVAMDPPKTLRNVHLLESVNRKPLVAELLLGAVQHHVSTLVYVGDVSFLRMPNLAHLRALSAVVDGVDTAALRSLGHTVEQMTSLRFLRLYVTHKSQVTVAMAPSSTVDHLDLGDSVHPSYAIWPYRHGVALPPGLCSVDSDAIDPRLYPSLRVLATDRAPDATFASLASLITRATVYSSSFATLASLTNLQFLSTYVSRRVADLYATLAALPLLACLCLLSLRRASPSDAQPSVVDASAIVLPALRRLMVREALLQHGLPSLPAIEVVYVVHKDDDNNDVGRSVFCDGHRQRTPWTADQRDLLLRSRALCAMADFMMPDEHDVRCMPHRAPDGPPTGAVASGERRVAGLPFSHYEPEERTDACTCQLLSYDTSYP